MCSANRIAPPTTHVRPCCSFGTPICQMGSDSGTGSTRARTTRLITSCGRSKPGSSTGCAGRTIVCSPLRSMGRMRGADIRRMAGHFLRALYRRLASDPRVKTVTFSEYLRGNAARGVDAHPASRLARVHDLATGSWIDEPGSASGVDLGTWIGEPEENAAWNLLGATRSAYALAGDRAPANEQARRSLFAAEGSDWYWWFGRRSGVAERRGIRRAISRAPPGRLRGARSRGARSAR